MRRSAYRVLLVQIVATVVVALEACTAGHLSQVPAPNVVVATSTTAARADFSTAVLASVPGRRIIRVPIGPGDSTLNGSVAGPAGPIPGATVHVERVVEGVIGSADVATAPDGTWSLRGILGGQFRVRAWRSPDLAQTRPAILFLSTRETKSLNLQLDSFGGSQVSSSVAPTPPVVGAPSALVVQVTTNAVDNLGVVRAIPKTGVTVELFGVGAWTFVEAASQTVGATGLVTWTVTCDQPGPQQLQIVIDSADVFPLDVAPCVNLPGTTVPSTTSSTGTTRPRRTTTTFRGP